MNAHIWESLYIKIIKENQAINLKVGMVEVMERNLEGWKEEIDERKWFLLKKTQLTRTI